jgi:hypothetical protein
VGAHRCPHTPRGARQAAACRPFRHVFPTAAARSPPARPPAPPRTAPRAAVCGTLNHRLDPACAGCGALRWDGPAGQLAARAAAVLQTADLDRTTGKQVAARLAAEAGSRPGLGAEVQPRALRAVVADLMQRRQQQRQGGGRSTPPPGGPAAAAAVPGARSGSGAAEPPGAAAEARPVVAGLTLWLQEWGVRPRRGAAAGGPEGDGGGGGVDEGDTLQAAAALATTSMLPLLRRLRARAGGAAAGVAPAAVNALEGPEVVADPALALVGLRGNSWEGRVPHLGRGAPAAVHSSNSHTPRRLARAPPLPPRPHPAPQLPLGRPGV